MDHPLIDLISAKIAAAEARGEFDNLPGAGQPLPPCDDPENALLHRVMRENGALPPYVALSRELAKLRLELREATDETRRREIMRDMSMMEIKIDIARNAWK